MEPILLLITFLLACGLHFGIQKIFVHFRYFDDFNHRSTHKTLATRTGGLGVFLASFLVALFYYLHGVELFDYSLFIPLGIMFIVGVYDDFYRADFKLKFLLQLIVAKILIDQGYVIANYHGLFGLYEVPWLLAQASTLFVFLVVVNAINFVDGIDGLALTEVIKTILLIEYFSAAPTALFPLGVLIIVSMIPLYYFNFKKKEKVFLGDAGSLFLGSLILVYLLYLLSPNYSFRADYEINKALFAVLVVLYPLTDLLRVFVLRIKAGKSPFVADQNHLHHFLLNNLKSSILVILLIEIVAFGFLIFI